MRHVLLSSLLSLANQLQSPDTIYEIRNAFDANGAELVIGDGSILHFNGGSISNATIIASNCIIEAPLVKIFDNVTFEGDFLNGQMFNIEWFVSKYETSFVPNSTKNASGEITQALNSGIKKVYFNNDRYFPIGNTIKISSNVDIFGRIQYMGNSVYYRKDPCIYNNANADDLVTLLEYDFPCTPPPPSTESEESEVTPEPIDSNSIQTRLNIDGLNLFRRGIVEGFNTDKDTPIVKITNYGAETLWGLHININVISDYREQPDLNDNHFSPSYTGIQIIAANGSISHIEIHGYICMTFNAYNIHTLTTKWITDTKIYGNTRCVKGGKLSAGHVVRNFGSHQAMPSNEISSEEAYFESQQLENYGYIWDLGHEGNCKYAVKPNNISFNYDDSQEKYSKVEIVKPTDVFYPNLLAKLYPKYTQEIQVSENIFENGGLIPTNSLESYRFIFPERLIRSDNLQGAIHKNSSSSYFCYSQNRATNYTYELTLTIEGTTELLGYIDNPPLYFSPIFAQNDFYIEVKYYRKNQGSDIYTEIEEESFMFNYVQTYDNRNENSIDSSYFYGRFIKIQNIFSKHVDMKFCKTVIFYHQDLSNISLRNRPVFFIPDYRIDKMTRVVDGHDSIKMSQFDIGEIIFDSRIKKNLSWGGQDWTDYDGISASIKRAGQFSEAPAHSDVYPGFHYFCTSGAVINGIAKTNVDIISTGTKWVDSQGNTVR